VVISPHLDDAVLSLGATVIRAVAEGAELSIVTVLAGDPGSAAPAGHWDAACGFATEGEAARGRREEDRRACALVGARPAWLPFRDKQYAGERDPEAVWDALEPQLDADLVLVPGYPVVHSDHEFVAGLLLARLPTTRRVGFYLERAYALGWNAPRHAAQALSSRGRGLSWVQVRPRPGEARTKGRACRAYRSQFRLLGPHLPRRLAVPEVWWAAESFGCPDGTW
jgi:LmbE family N-acetylglucosaminyl deacetylase